MITLNIQENHSLPLGIFQADHRKFPSELLHPRKRFPLRYCWNLTTFLKFLHSWLKLDFLLKTYDVPSYDIDVEPEIFPEGRFQNRGLRRSQSFATTSRYAEPNTLHRSISRQSFSSELQVFEIISPLFHSVHSISINPFRTSSLSNLKIIWTNEGSSSHQTHLPASIWLISWE